LSRTLSEQSRAILHEADRRLRSLASGGHYLLYQYVRLTAGSLARTDAFYVGFCRDDRTIVFPYNYDGEEYDDPNVHPYVQGGLTEWILKHRRPYWSRTDEGRLLGSGRPFGNVTRRSREAIVVPLIASEGGARRRVIGVMSMQSYEAGVYTEETVLCLAYLAESLTTVLQREQEDAERRRRFGMEVPAAGPPRVSQVIGDLGERLKSIRRKAEALCALVPDGPSPVRVAAEELCRTCEQTQTETIELLLRCMAPQENPLVLLTDKEREVTALLVEGCTNRDIGERLFISETTAKTHCSNIIRKLDAGGRSGVVQLVKPFLSTPSE
jgi:DNA-binding CsgD family transcriptional regulator